MQLQVKKLAATAQSPWKASPQEAGYDLFAHLPSGPMTIKAHSQSAVPTGIAIAIPEHHYGQVAPRSGLALKKQIYIGAGVIDETYRGEVFIILYNHGDEDFEVLNGDRVAQLLVIPVASPEIEVITELPESVRGTRGFGSSGVHSVIQMISSTKLFISESLPVNSKTDALVDALQSGLKANETLEDVLCTLEKETSLFIQSHTNLARIYRTLADGIDNIPVLAGFFKGNASAEFQSMIQIIRSDSTTWIENEAFQYAYVTWLDGRYFIWAVEYQRVPKRFRWFRKLLGRDLHKLSEKVLYCSCYLTV